MILHYIIVCHDILHHDMELHILGTHRNYTKLKLRQSFEFLPPSSCRQAILRYPVFFSVFFFLPGKILKSGAGITFCVPRQSFEFVATSWDGTPVALRREEDTIGNPRRAQTSQFELFELILSSKLDKPFPVEQFEATVSQSTVPPS